MSLGIGAVKLFHDHGAGLRFASDDGSDLVGQLRRSATDKALYFRRCNGLNAEPGAFLSRGTAADAAGHIAVALAAKSSAEPG